jgi:hypothetical protein
VLAFLEGRGQFVSDPLSLASLHDLDLPREVF